MASSPRRPCPGASCLWTRHFASLSLQLFIYEMGDWFTASSKLFWLTNEKPEILTWAPPALSPLPFSSSVPSLPPGLPERPQQSPPALEINHYPLREFGTSLLPPRPLGPLPLALKARHTQVVKLPVRSVYMSLMDPTWRWCWSQQRCPHHPWCPTGQLPLPVPPSRPSTPSQNFSAPMSHSSPHSHGYPANPVGVLAVLL